MTLLSRRIGTFSLFLVENRLTLQGLVAAMALLIVRVTKTCYMFFILTMLSYHACLIIPRDKHYVVVYRKCNPKDGDTTIVLFCLPGLHNPLWSQLQLAICTGLSHRYSNSIFEQLHGSCIAALTVVSVLNATRSQQKVGQI